MKLRPRLAFFVVAAAIPLVLAVIWARAEIDRRAAEQAILEVVLDRLEHGGREQCEASPATFPEPVSASADARPWLGQPPPPCPPDGPPPPPPLEGRPHPGPPPRVEMFAYTSALTSANPRAPPFPEELARALRDGRPVVSRRCSIEPAGGGPPQTGVIVGARMGWRDGPCAVVLARRPDLSPDGPFGAILLGAAAMCAGLLVIVLLAAGPIVRRIRRLTAQVRRSALDHYETPVEVSGTDETAELARAFNEAGAELRSHVASLEKREETLRSFVANTTHDVATPLTVLQGHLAALRKQVDGGGEIDRERIRDSLEEAHYMASLLHNLGAAAKLEAGEPHLRSEPVDLGRLVERAVLRHRPIGAQSEVAIEFAVPEHAVRASGDETLVEQAVSNVIQNAVRYNHAGGHVVVILEMRSEGRAFSLRIVDDGPGVPEADMVRLCDRSFRGDAARSRHPSGLGLGLHIAKDVASRHGFEMRLRRSEHGGLEVEFTGPILRAAGA